MPTLFLMNIKTGSVDTEENWLAEIFAWADSPDECLRQFKDLVEVVKDENGNWIEVK